MQGSLDTPPIVLTQARLNLGLRLVGGLVFIALGGWLIAQRRIDMVAIGLISIAVFSWAVIGMARDMFWPTSLLIGPEGVEQRGRNRPFKLTWSQVAGIRTLKSRGGASVGIDPVGSAKPYWLNVGYLPTGELVPLLEQAQIRWSRFGAKLSDYPPSHAQAIPQDSGDRASFTTRAAGFALMAVSLLVSLYAAGSSTLQPQGSLPPDAPVRWAHPPVHAPAPWAFAQLAIAAVGLVLILTGRGRSMAGASGLPPWAGRVVIWICVFSGGMATTISINTLSIALFGMTYRQQDLAMSWMKLGLNVAGWIVFVAAIAWSGLMAWKARQAGREGTPPQ